MTKMLQIRNNVYDTLAASKPKTTSWSDWLQAIRENSIERVKENMQLKEENKKLKEENKKLREQTKL